MIIGIDATRGNLDYKTGVEWYSYYIIRWLAKIDNKNTYVLYSNVPLTKGLLDLCSKQFSESNENFTDEIYDKKGFQILKSPHNNFKCKVLNWPLKNFWTQGRLSLEMLFKSSEIDVFFTPSHVLPLIFHKNSISTIHDIGFEKYKILYRNDSITTYKKIFRKLLNLTIKIFTLNKYSASKLDYLKWSNRYTLKHSKKIITVSNFTKKELKTYYRNIASDEKINVVHNGYNESLFVKNHNIEKINEIKQKYGTGEKFIFYIGRIEKKKNIINLINAYAALIEKNKNITERLVLVGMADFGFDEVKYLIRQYDLTNKIIIPGWVEEIDLPVLYNGASLFVFPSKYEGFGIPLLQAMACGVPVAASLIPSISEVVDGAATLFDPDSPQSIAKTIEEVLINKNLSSSLISKGLKRVENFSWEKCAKDTLRIINTME